MQYIIGTSGWNYKHWQVVFYPLDIDEGQWLPYYAQVFESVEINTTFYHLPQEVTFANWKHAVAADFIFAVKASRYITHMKNLKDGDKTVPKFMYAASRLEEKLGPILFQFPPRWQKNTARLKDFISGLDKKFNYAFEFRHKSWYAEDVYKILRKNCCAIVLHDHAEASSPIISTIGWTYIRLHGPQGCYQGKYSNEMLQAWKQKIETLGRLERAYIYFNNDFQANAIDNAQALRAMLRDE